MSFLDGKYHTSNLFSQLMKRTFPNLDKNLITEDFRKAPILEIFTIFHDEIPCAKVPVGGRKV